MAKQLFNTTEKSNFILNLTEEKYAKLAAFGLSAACLLPSLLTLIPEISRKSLYALTSAGLSIAGVFCMILALIALIKKYINGKKVFPVCAMGAMLVWGVISLINSYDVGISLYGFTGRGEGLLAIIFYCCFFITAAAIRREQAISALVTATITAGLINSAFALIQIFTGKLSSYRMISMETQANAASGLSQSPLFLAMVLSLALTAAIFGFVCSDSRSKRIFCFVSACLFSFVMIFTYSLIGICGLVLGLAAAFAAVFATGAPRVRLVSLAAVIVPAAAAVIIVQAGLIGNLTSYRLYDGRILWFADSYYRLSASGDFDFNRVDIDDTYDVYYTLNSKTLTIIGQHSLTGTGPDQLVFPQLTTDGGLDLETADITDVISQNKGTFDKVYNEYLYTAATRGVPSLIALILALLAVVFSAFRSIKQKKPWTAVCVSFMALWGVLIFLVGVSNITFSPIFWAAAGAAICGIAPEKDKSAEN